MEYKYPNEKRYKERKKKMSVKDKGRWIVILFIFSGLVVGSLLGSITSNIDFLKWLSYGEEFGLREPIDIDLMVIRINFGMMIKINIASIIGLIASLLIYRKV